MTRRAIRSPGRQVIQAGSLDLAARHEAYCVAANRGLDGTIIPIAPASSPSGEANIDAINREADRICQERYRHYEPDLSYCAAEFAEFCRAEIASGFFHLNCRTVRTGSPSAGLFTNEDCPLVTE